MSAQRYRSGRATSRSRARSSPRGEDAPAEATAAATTTPIDRGAGPGRQGAVSYNGRLTMGILDRYVWKELAPPLIIGTGVFTFFLFIDRIYQLTNLVITKNVPFSLV